MAKSLLLASLPLAISVQTTELICLGGRAHSLSYDVIGDTLEQVSDAHVLLEPADDVNGVCSGPSGDKSFCIGANIDGSCTTAVQDVKITDFADCSKCFVGLATDIYYKLEIEAFKLKRVEVGLRGSHLRGAVEVHAHKQGDVPIAKGSIDIIDASRTAKINFKVAKIIPVDITLALPTRLDYSLDLQGEIDVTAGVDVDVDLGDHFISWTKADGFVVHNTSASVTPTPVLSWNSGAASANLGLSLHSSAHVDVDRVMWYHFNVDPSVPTKIDYVHPGDQVCANTNVDIPLAHEADVHFTLLGKEHDVYHFGPEEIYHYHKDQALHKCVNATVV